LSSLNLISFNLPPHATEGMQLQLQLQGCKWWNCR